MNLVVQGPALASGDLEALSLLAKPQAVREIGPRAFRFIGAMKNEGIAPLCEARRLDHAWIEQGRRFSDLRLLAMDMDSTLITIECIDELGDFAGKKAEIAAIPRRRCAAKSSTRRACGDASPLWRAFPKQHCGTSTTSG